MPRIMSMKCHQTDNNMTDQQQEFLSDITFGESNCCGAKIYMPDICSACKEHCVDTRLLCTKCGEPCLDEGQEASLCGRCA